MIFQRRIFGLIWFVMGASAWDASLVHFIKSYIENEGKPTFLVLHSVCWGNNFETNLAKEVSKIGVRTSTLPKLQSNHLHFLLFLVDLDCLLAEEIIDKASSRNLFRSPYRWLVLANNSTEISKVSALQNSPILADSDLVLAERRGEEFKMIELHKPSLNASMRFSMRGHYNGSLVDARPHRQLFRRRRDLAQHTLTMSNVIQDSNTTRYHLPREDRLEPQYDSISKICWINVRLGMEMLNATPRYIFNNRWGYKVDGKWSGMINDLHTERADLGTNCVLDSGRFDVVSYTDLMAPFRVRFIFRQPPLPYVANIFSMPFSNNVWIAIFVCAVVSTVTLYMESVWELEYEKRSPTQLDGRVGDAMLLAMSAVGQQGCVMEPKRTPGRMMVWVLFTALMALYAAYSANVVVLLQAPSHSIRNLAHLAQAKITLAANDVDYNHFVFSLYKDPIRVTIYKRVDPEKGKKQFYNINDGVERIRQGLFAFHSIVEPVYRRIEETFLETEKCDLMEVDFLNSFDPFVPVRKDSPYLELFRVVFKQVRESGLRSAVSGRLQAPRPRCARATAFSSVGLLATRPLLLLMIYGTAVSLIILAAEIVIHKISRRNSVYSRARLF